MTRERGPGTPLSLPLCDWCRAELADGWLDDSPACLNCADGLLVGDGLPLAAQLAIEERARRPKPPSRNDASFYLRTPEKWLAEMGWYGKPVDTTNDPDWDIPF